MTDELEVRSEVAALQAALGAGTDYEVAVEPDRAFVGFLLEELYDQEVDGWVTIADPHPVGVTFLHEEGDRWTTVVTTPIITSLGELGRFDPGEVGLKLVFVNVEGSATAELVRTGHAIDDPIEQLHEAVGWFIDLVAELGPTSLTFAGFEEQSVGPLPTTPGFLQLHQAGHGFDANDSEQRATIDAAVEIFAAAGLDEQRLRAMAIGALTATTQGRMNEALEIIEQCDTEYEELSLDVPELGGQIASILGILRAGFFGQRGPADEALQRAEEFGLAPNMQELVDLSRTGYAPRTSRLFVETEAGLDDIDSGGDSSALIGAAISNAFHHKRLSQWDEARVYLEQALELAERDEPSSIFHVLFELCGVQLSLGDRAGAEASYRRLRASEPPEGLMGQIQQAGVGLFGMLLGDPDSEAMLESVQDVDLGLMSSLTNMALDFQRRGTTGERDPLGYIDEFIGLIDGTGDELAKGLFHTELGRHRLGLADLEPSAGGGGDPREAAVQIERAMDDTLAGIRHHDRARHQLESPRDRSAYLADAQVSYELALFLACEQGRPALVAELLERLRAIGLPDGSGDDDGGLLAVTEPAHTSIGGRSELAPEDATTIELGERIAEQAGPGAWWWSAWRGRSHLVWVVRAPDGELEAGSIELDPADSSAGPGSLREHLDVLRGAIRLSGDPSTADALPGEPDKRTSEMIDGPLGRRYGTEGVATLHALGDLMIPPALRQALLGASTERPVRLLYSLGPSLAWLPVGLLVVDQGVDGLQLVERAVPQMMAPELGPSPRRPADSASARSVGRRPNPMKRPTASLDLLAAVTDQVPKRALRKLDKQPDLANSWTWTTADSTVTVATGAETVTLSPQDGVVGSLSQVGCTCLLAPKCLHIAAVLAALEPSASTPAASADGGDAAAASDDGAEAPPALDVSSDRVEAADRMWVNTAALLQTGAARAGTVLVAELQRAVHGCRVAGLHRLSAAGLRVAQQLRALRQDSPAFALSDLTRDLADVLQTAHGVRHGRARAATIGTARRRYEAIGNLRAVGLCTLPVVSNGGYAGVVTVFAGPDGRLWSLSDVQPGGIERIAMAYAAGLAIGDVSQPHREIVRQGLLLAGATASEDGRLGAGKNVKAVTTGTTTWDDERLAGRFARPFDDQVRTALETESPARIGLASLIGEVVGSDGTGLIVEIRQAGLLRCLPAYAHSQLPAVDNLELLARAPGLALRLVVELDGDRPGNAIVHAVGPARVDDEPSAVVGSKTAQFRLPVSWAGRCNVALDPLERSHLSTIEPRPRVVRFSSHSAIDPLTAVRRRLQRAVLGGARTLPSGTRTEIEREATHLERRLMPAAARLHRDLASTAQWTRQTMVGTRSAVDPDAFASDWLRAFTYEAAARRRLALETWLAEIQPQ